MAALFPAFRRMFIVMLVVGSVPLAVFWGSIQSSSLVEERPHGPALCPTVAVTRVRQEAREGRLDGDAGIVSVLATAS